MAKQFALAFLDILELLPLVGQNVLPALSVLRMRLAIIKNVEIHVLVHVESMQTVKSEATIQFVLALLDTLAILSLDVKLKLFNIIHHQILVNRHLVDQMLSAEQSMIRHHAHASHQ
jgi:hypothetical protein